MTSLAFQTEMDRLGLPGKLLELLRCLECCGRLQPVDGEFADGYPELGSDGVLRCRNCGERYPVIGGTPRMLPRARRPQLWMDYPRSAAALRRAEVPVEDRGGEHLDDVRRQTARSFQYEWERFGSLREEWRRNFADYMQPHPPESLRGRLILDVGTGSGRHSFHASENGARVVAVDLGGAIDVARRNLPSGVLTVQADAEQLPFDAGSFDLVMSIGVLHHLPDPERALARISPLARRGGHVHVYLYWIPERAGHVRILRLVTVARRLTVRLPHRLLHALCVPLAALLAVSCVWPYRLLRRIPAVSGLADVFPLKTYADYPFGVLVNDQFDRFSAPLECRYTRDAVADMLESAGLDDVVVLPSNGWIGDGRAPDQGCR